MFSEEHRVAACCQLIAEVVSASGEAHLKVNGTSMLPSVWPGDVATVKRCGITGLRPGHIVLYSRNGALTAHRLLRVAGNQLLLRGDSRSSLDPPVHTDQLVGLVSAVHRNGRFLNPDQSVQQRILAFMLRHSDLCLHLLLRFGSPNWFGQSI